MRSGRVISSTEDIKHIPTDLFNVGISDTTIFNTRDRNNPKLW